MTAGACSCTADAEAATLRKEAREHKEQLEDVLQATSTGTPRSIARPWDTDVAAARSALRASYVALLLSCTFTRAAQLVDTMIWSDTTYCFISTMRASLARLERQAQQAPTSKGDAPKQDRKSAKLKAYQTTMDDLLRFIDDESAFYAALLMQITRLFQLDELQDMLTTLRLQDVSGVQASDLTTPSTLRPDMLEAAHMPAYRHQLYETLQRLLIYLGDLARYREMHAVLPPILAPRRRGGEPRSPDFARAVQLYHKAHLLLPDHGNPSNQLAVIATFVGDTFGATYQYYRALCVRMPFDKARHNLHRLLDKAFAAWSASALRDEVLTAWRQAALEDSPGRRVPVPTISARWSSTADWFESVVQFHSLCALRADLDAAWVLNDALLKHVLTMTEVHELRAVDYLRLVVTGICASWLARLWRAPPHAKLAFAVGEPYSAHIPSDTIDEHVRHAWESLLVCHVLGLLAALLAVNRHTLVSTLRAQPTSLSEPQLLSVSRGLRRTLPAIRMGLKWVKGHVAYMAQCRTQAAAAATELQQAVDTDEAASRLATDAVARLACMQRSVDARMTSFWSALIDFCNLLRAAYPFDLLPTVHEASQDVGRIRVHVAEDDDLRYLGPIRRAMQHGEESQYALPVQEPTDCASAGSDYARITDILIDAKVMSESPSVDMAFDDTRAMFVARASLWAVDDQEDDPLELAMRALNAGAAPTVPAPSLWNAMDPTAASPPPASTASATDPSSIWSTPTTPWKT
ncbi:hypothetical protein ACI68E_003873 [Malassezia pachydermatis]|uniref:Uncharacterized protein n=1 Tax=Malassezia pachydermatis TaxID=77020 RepID=A0A0M8MM48_9BASI|nr:hypothetical protein Malapachy_0513 [Malassezia pachydermatis]KOS12897.1 hypothetical protein Malapachy_0513 [Malassezia pachydermatis]